MNRVLQWAMAIALGAFLLDGLLDVFNSRCPHTIIKTWVPIAGELNGLPFQGHIIYQMEGPRQCLLP